MACIHGGEMPNHDFRLALRDEKQFGHRGTEFHWSVVLSLNNLWDDGAELELSVGWPS